MEFPQGAEISWPGAGKPTVSVVGSQIRASGTQPEQRDLKSVRHGTGGGFFLRQVGSGGKNCLGSRFLDWTGQFQGREFFSQLPEAVQVSQRLTAIGLTM